MSKARRGAKRAKAKRGNAQLAALWRALAERDNRRWKAGADPELDAALLALTKEYGRPAWFYVFAATVGPRAIMLAIADLIEAGGPLEDEKPLSRVGDAVSRSVRREMLRLQLAESHWNLSHAARASGVGTTSGEMIREIRKLGLEAFWKEAKKSGAVRPGRPKKQAQET